MKKFIINIFVIATSILSYVYADVVHIQYPASSDMSQKTAYKTGFSYVTPLQSHDPYSTALSPQETRQQGTQWWGTGPDTFKVPTKDVPTLGKPAEFSVVAPSAAIEPEIISPSQQHLIVPSTPVTAPQSEYTIQPYPYTSSPYPTTVTMPPNTPGTDTDQTFSILPYNPEKNIGTIETEEGTTIKVPR